MDPVFPRSAAPSVAAPADSAELERDDLERRRQQLDAERRQFLADLAAKEEERQRRNYVAWERLKQETAKVAAEKQLAARLHQHASTDLEISRQQLAAAWNQLHSEQEVWRERTAQEATAFQDQQERLEQERLRLRQFEEALKEDRATQEQAQVLRVAELAGLERRVQNYCAKLAELRQETARLEDTLDGGMRVDAPKACPATPVTLPVGPENMLAFLAATAQDLVDQSRHLIELRQRLIGLRDSWREKWQHALTAIAEAEAEQRQRERGLTAQEQELERREMVARSQLADLHRKQSECQCWAARLARRQSAFQAERSRLLGSLKLQASGIREQRQLLLRLQQIWQDRRDKELHAYHQLCQAREAAREDYLLHRNAFRERFNELDVRESDLAERDFVLTVARQQLLANDPRPAAAERELQRRLKHLQQIVRKPLRGLEQREREIAMRLQHLEAARLQLVQQEQDLIDREVACKDRQTEVEADQATLSEQRIRWQAELQVLRQERTRLQTQVQELEQQVDRLTLILMGNQRQDMQLPLAA